MPPISNSATTTSTRSKGGFDMATTALPKIGFVGLGHMGGNMAVRLLDAGYEVYGVDGSRPRRLVRLHDHMRWRTTPREVTEVADVVFTSLPDDGVLEA